MTLSEICRGQKATIKEIADDAVRIQALRFGIAEGTVVTCAEKLPSGPVIIQVKRQELALGRTLAAKILVNPGGEAR